MCERCEAARKEAEEKGEIMRLQVGEDVVLTFTKEGDIAIHTRDIPLLREALRILVGEVKETEEEALRLKRKDEMLTLAIGTLHGWLRSIASPEELKLLGTGNDPPTFPMPPPLKGLKS